MYHTESFLKEILGLGKEEKKPNPDKSIFSFWFQKQHPEMKGYILQILL